MTSPERWKGFVSGGVGGVCLVVTGHPFDTLKVRLQVDTGGIKYRSLSHCARELLRNEGLSGFYKGMATPAIGVTPIFSTYFLGYHLGQDLLRSSSSKGSLLYREHLMAGMMAGFLTSGISGPGERIKCLLQVQNKTSNYSGPIDCILQLYQQSGIRGIFKGTLATMIRDVPASGVYFTSYEFMKNQLSNKRGEMEVGATLLAGGVAGICNWMVALPADVIKSRLQTDTSGDGRGGVGQVLGRLVREEGVRALYRGALPVLLRAFPANAACFLGYETTLKCLNYAFA